MPASLLTTTGFVPFLTQVGTAWQKASTVALTLPFSGILVRRPKNQPRVNSKTRSYSRKQLWRRWSRLLLQENAEGGDDNMFFNFTFNPQTRFFEVNGHSFNTTGIPAPVLLQILGGSRPPRELLPEETIFYVERNRTIEVNFPALPLGGPHPFHLHGVRFLIGF